MNRKMILGAVVAAVAVLVVTYLLQPSPKDKAIKALNFSYACADGVVVLAAFAADFQSVRVTLPGQTINMSQAMAASGVRYTGSDYTFWSKGDTAFVMKGEETIISDCRKN